MRLLFFSSSSTLSPHFQTLLNLNKHLNVCISLAVCFMSGVSAVYKSLTNKLGFVAWQES